MQSGFTGWTDEFTETKRLAVFKWVTANGRAPWGMGTWSLPPSPGVRGKTKGIGSSEPMICHRGIHGYLDIEQLIEGLASQRLFVAELWGRMNVRHDKVVAQHGCLCYELTFKGGLTFIDLQKMYTDAKRSFAFKERYATDARRKELLAPTLAAINGLILPK